MEPNELKAELAELCGYVHKLEAEVGRVLVGQNEVVRGTLIAMLAGGHVLLEGVPGLGKTLLVKTLADAVEGKFSRIQFTPDLMPGDLTGTNIMTEHVSGTKRFEFQPGPIFANIVLADEINRATPKTQSALLEAMQEHSVTVSGTTHRLGNFFFVLATQNPLDMEGTYPLPEAQLDRFFCKILVQYPSAEELLGILDRTASAVQPTKIKRTFSAAQILELGMLAREVPAAEEISRFAVNLVLGTHPKSTQASALVRQYVRFGASPRGAQSLMLGAKIRAVLDGRYNVSLDDLKALAPMVLRHRIILNFEGQAENITTDNIIQSLLKQ